MTTNRVLRAESGDAPRMLRAWRHLEALLADGQWHRQTDLAHTVSASSSVAVRTVENLLHDARFTKPPRVQTTGRGQQRRYRSWSADA